MHRGGFQAITTPIVLLGIRDMPTIYLPGTVAPSHSLFKTATGLAGIVSMDSVTKESLSISVRSRCHLRSEIRGQTGVQPITTSSLILEAHPQLTMMTYTAIPPVPITPAHLSVGCGVGRSREQALVPEKYRETIDELQF